jgi:hypothetical protein
MKKQLSNQLSFLGLIKYNKYNYKTLREAMISAMQDFYILKKFPPPIITINRTYNLRDMKQYWRRYELEDVYF